jgi:hypothetical protein
LPADTDEEPVPWPSSSRIGVASAAALDADELLASMAPMILVPGSQ